MFSRFNTLLTVLLLVLAALAGFVTGSLLTKNATPPPLPPRALIAGTSGWPRTIRHYEKVVSCGDACLLQVPVTFSCCIDSARIIYEQGDSLLTITLPAPDITESPVDPENIRVYPLSGPPAALPRPEYAGLIGQYNTALFTARQEALATAEKDGAAEETVRLTQAWLRSLLEPAGYRVNFSTLKKEESER